MKHERVLGFLGSEQNEQRQKGEFCDVILSIGERHFNAHRSVLAACSPYLRALFLKKQMPASGKVTISMDESIADDEVLEVLIAFFYTGSIDINNANVQSLLAAADFLLLTELKNDCCKYLKSELGPGNCLGIAALAERHSCEDLHKMASQFALNNFEAVYERGEFLELSLENTLKLLKSDKLMVTSEASVVSAALCWVRHDEMNRKAHLIEILVGGARLTLCTEEFLARTVNEDDLIRSSEECQRTFADAIQAKKRPPSQALMELPRTPASLRQSLCIFTGTKRGDCTHVDEIKMLVANRGQAFSVITASIPQRHDFAIATLADRVYVLGGRDDLGIHLPSVDCYNVSNNQWTSLAPMPTARYGHRATVLDGHIYVMGGFLEEGAQILSVERYDPVNDSWQAVTRMLGTLYRPTTAVTVDDAIYVLGGVDFGAERFSLNSDSWSALPLPRTCRIYFGCAVFDGKIFIAGGCHDYEYDDDPMADVECFDPATQQWTYKGDLIEARSHLHLAVIDDRLLAVGGDTGRGGRPLTSVEEYVPATNSWRLLCNFPAISSDCCVDVVCALSTD